jgi:Xaa-Pro aminopeptidase
MLDRSERDWLDAYHRRVFETLAPQLDEGTRDWLERATLPI